MTTGIAVGYPSHKPVFISRDVQCDEPRAGLIECDHMKRTAKTINSPHTPPTSHQSQRSHTHHTSYGPYSPTHATHHPPHTSRQSLLTSSCSYSHSHSTSSRPRHLFPQPSLVKGTSYQGGSEARGGASRRPSREENWHSESWSYDTHPQTSSVFRQRPRPIIHQPYSLPSYAEDCHPPRETSYPTPVTLHQPPSKSLSSNALSSPYSVRSSYIDIVSHPEDQSVELGACVQLVCNARILNTSHHPLYQWYKDEEPLVGELKSLYSIGHMASDDVGYYFCVVSTMTGSLQRKSHTAHVALKEEDISKPSQPIILEQPDEVIHAYIGHRLVLKLTVQASPEPIYLWYKEGEEMGSVSGPELVFPCITPRDEAHYTCCVKNSLGSQLSRSFAVQVAKTPPTLQHDSNDDDDDDDDVTLHHKEREPSPEVPVPSYRTPSSPVKTVRGGSAANGVSDGVLNIVAGQLCNHLTLSSVSVFSRSLGISIEDLVRIRARVGNLHEIILQLLLLWRSQTPYVTPQSLELLLQEEGYMITIPQSASSHPRGHCPVILSHPENTRALYGENVNLKMEAAGPNLYYQWFQNGSMLPNCTGPVLVIPRLQESSTGAYHCEVRNLHGTVTTHLAEVDIMYGKPKLPPSLREIYQPPSYGSSYATSPLSSATYSPTFEYGRGMRNGESPYSSMESLTSGLTPKVSKSGCHLGMMSERFGEMGLDDHQEYAYSAPVIKIHPQSQTIGTGERLLLNVVAVGGDHLHYMWYFNGLELTSHTRPDFLLYHVTDEDVGDYLCQVSNEIGSVKSNIARVTLRGREEETGQEENRPLSSDDEEVRHEENRDNQR